MRPSIENLKKNSTVPIKTNEKKIYIKLPTFSKNILRNEVLHMKTTNMAIVRKNSLNTNSQKDQPINMRRKSQVLSINSPKNRFGSPVNFKKITRNPPNFVLNTRNPVFTKNDESEVQTPVRIPSNQTVISFTDVSMYKTNLIDFFREEEEKEIRKKSETNIIIKGIMKNNQKKESEFMNFDKSSKKNSSQHVYLRFEDQVIAASGSIFNQIQFFYEEIDEKLDILSKESLNSIVTISSGVNSPSSHKSLRKEKTKQLNFEFVNEKINQYVFVKNFERFIHFFFFEFL